AFNAWLYNALGASNTNSGYYTAFNDFTDGTNEELEYGTGNATATNGLMTRCYKYVNFSATGTPGVTAANAYELNWTASSQTPPPNVPAFCDGLFAETTPTPADPPIPGQQVGLIQTSSGTLQGIAPVGSTPTVGMGLTGGAANYSINGGTVSSATGMFRVCINRHQMHVNVGFIDGHAETVSLGNLWTLPWTAPPAIWSNPTSIISQ
ncbi:MAG TPA: hypothetical protein VKJ65_02280, partial [Phycisphaerae bacterium]|nr:hypothetical protein [Phycisphaerae bacterium]